MNFHASWGIQHLVTICRNFSSTKPFKQFLFFLSRIRADKARIGKLEKLSSFNYQLSEKSSDVKSHYIKTCTEGHFHISWHTLSKPHSKLELSSFLIKFGVILIIWSMYLVQYCILMFIMNFSLILKDLYYYMKQINLYECIPTLSNTQAKRLDVLLWSP